MSGLWRPRRFQGFPHGDDRVKLWRKTLKDAAVTIP